MSADPLAVHVGQADPNLYAYVSGRALQAVDPLGLDCGPDYCGPGAAKSNADAPDESKSGYEPPPITPRGGDAKAEREVEVTAGGAQSPKAGPSWADRPLPQGLRTREAQTWGEGVKLGVETNPWGGGAANELLTKAIQKLGQWLGKMRAGAAVADDLAYATAGAGDDFASAAAKGAPEANVHRMAAKPGSTGVERVARVKGPEFPELKDHAARHSSLEVNRYYNQAVAHMKTGQPFKVRHDGEFKQAFITRLGEDSFQYTATSLNGRTIFTHMVVKMQYLKNVGITLPEGF